MAGVLTVALASVRTEPGATVLTLMPSWPACAAMWRLNWLSAAFAVDWATLPAQWSPSMLDT